MTTRNTVPSLVLCRHRSAVLSPSGRGCGVCRSSSATSSAGRISRSVMARNSSREKPYCLTAASFTSRKASVSRSKIHMGCEFLANGIPALRALARSPFSLFRLRRKVYYFASQQRSTEHTKNRPATLALCIPQVCMQDAASNRHQRTRMYLGSVFITMYS